VNKPKYLIGQFVRIASDLGASMKHFKSDAFARVAYLDGHGMYGLFVQVDRFLTPTKWREIAWYDEHQLSLVTDIETIRALNDEIELYDEYKNILHHKINNN
jgi:hypothetical protein